MTGKVIQGFFLGGRPRMPAPASQPPAMPRRPGPPAPAFARQLPVAQSKAMPRPPLGPLVHPFAGRPPVAQPHGPGNSFQVDPGQLGLASGGGRPLPDAVRGKMEAALGADFSGVRVHVGPQAERIGAVAFTMGTDIYFAPGRFQPDTLHGQQLLGHELAHVVQQRQGRVRNPLGAGVAVVQDRALEAEADRLGQRAAARRDVVQPKSRPGAAQQSAAVRVSPPVSAGPASYRITAGTGGRFVGSVMVHARDPATVEVTDLGVDPARRGDGIGKMLLASAARAGQHLGRSKVTLAAQDNGSRRLTQWYKDLGFAQVGVSPRGHPRMEAPIGRLLGVAQRMERPRPGPERELTQSDLIGPIKTIFNVKRHAGVTTNYLDLIPQEVVNQILSLLNLEARLKLFHALMSGMGMRQILQSIGAMGFAGRVNLVRDILPPFKRNPPLALAELLRTTSLHTDKITRQLRRKLMEEPEIVALQIFCKKHNYTFPKQFGYHEVFGNVTCSIYPIEFTEQEQANRSKDNSRHRPILDLECVGEKIYARCYLGLYRAASGTAHKDIVADKSGKIELNNISLINLGNPFKALLWCEDYLKNKEHFDAKYPPVPILRSFLVPLSNASWFLDESHIEARPLDRDRGSGQFGSPGNVSFYAKALEPLVGSLVSFVVDEAELQEQEKLIQSGKPLSELKIPMSRLQAFLTGISGSLMDISKEGIAAQHGRKAHVAKFGDLYQNVMTAYYKSVEGAGFQDATANDKTRTLVTKLNEKQRPPTISINIYPLLLAEIQRRMKGLH